MQSALSAHGFMVKDIYYPVDQKTGESRGFAFVTMNSEDDAAKAIGALNHTLLNGRRIQVATAHEKKEPPETEDDSE